jgi:hypothetical protein
MKSRPATAALALALCWGMINASAAPITIDPTSDGSLYTCDSCIVVSDDAYVLVDGYIQGAIKFSSAPITGPITQAFLTLNPYGLPLWGPTVEVYGYGTNNGHLEEADANAGTFLGTLTLPPDLGYGEDAFFDVTSFILSVGASAPYIAFNLRSDGTDVFSSLEYNYGHPSQLIVTLASTVPEPSSVLPLLTALVAFALAGQRGRNPGRG